MSCGDSVMVLLYFLQEEYSDTRREETTQIEKVRAISKLDIE